MAERTDLVRTPHFPLYEGRLIMTTVHYADGGIATLYEILASAVMLLQATAQES